MECRPRLGGAFKHVLYYIAWFSPLFVENSHFDSYFSNGLKPPTKRVLNPVYCFGGTGLMDFFFALWFRIQWFLLKRLTRFQGRKLFFFRTPAALQHCFFGPCCSPWCLIGGRFNIVTIIILIVCKWHPNFCERSTRFWKLPCSLGPPNLEKWRF